MKRLFLTALAALAVSAAPAEAQTKLRAHYIWNRSDVDTEQRQLTGDKSGFGAGVEFGGQGLRLGLSGYTAGNVQEYDSQKTPLVVLAEANYQLGFGLFKPYVGVHSGLGAYTTDFFSKPPLPKLQDKGFGSVGYQFGVRIQPIPLGGVEVQWRKLSEFARSVQDPAFEDTQITIGVVLF